MGKTYGSVEELLQDIQDDIDLQNKTYASAAAHKGAEEITNFAKIAVDEFYGSYDPKYYNRWDNFKTGSYSPYLKNNGDIYYGGVKLSSGGMYEYPNAGISAADVFQMAMFGGIHGSPSVAVTEPPHDIIQKFVKDEGFQQKIQDIASKEARGQNYKVLFK